MRSHIAAQSASAAAAAVRGHQSPGKAARVNVTSHQQGTLQSNARGGGGGTYFDT